MKVKKLKVQGPNFFLENLTFFAFALDRCNNIKSLQRKGLFPCVLTPHMKLERYISKQVNKQVVVLKGVPMSSRTCDMIIEQIAKCNKAESLQLEKIKFGRGFDTIIKNTSSIKSLHLIDCSYNKYKDAPDTLESSLRNIKVENSHSTESSKELLTKVTNTFNFPSLTTLQLCKVDLTAEHLISLSEGNSAGRLPVLKDLRLINCYQLAGNLKYLFQKQRPWKCLEMLDCSSCDLQATDLKSLSEANAACYLPSLKHLDLGHNRDLKCHFREMLHTDSAWACLEILDWEYFTKAEAEYMLQVLQDKDKGKFPKLFTVKCTYHYFSKELKNKLQKYVKLETN